MADPRITPQDFQPVQRPKRKRCQTPTTNGASTSSFPSLIGLQVHKAMEKKLEEYGIMYEAHVARSFLTLIGL